MKLSIKNLNKTYRNGVKALNNINLDIETGMFGLLGAYFADTMPRVSEQTVPLSMELI